MGANAIRRRSGDRQEGQTRMGDTEKRPNQYRSALQLLPQGKDGATLTMMFEYDHAALLLLVFGPNRSIALPAAKINSLPIRPDRRGQKRTIAPRYVGRRAWPAGTQYLKIRLAAKHR
jgi:hypothetical protein